MSTKSASVVLHDCFRAQRLILLHHSHFCFNHHSIMPIYLITDWSLVKFGDMTQSSSTKRDKLIFKLSSKNLRFFSNNLLWAASQLIRSTVEGHPSPSCPTKSTCALPIKLGSGQNSEMMFLHK